MTAILNRVSDRLLLTHKPTLKVFVCGHPTAANRLEITHLYDQTKAAHLIYTTQ